MHTVAVIGGGAAGLMAAGAAAQSGASVLLFEKNTKVGRKLYITGKGRCNVTNDCDVQTAMGNIPRNPRFLYSAFDAFGPQETKEFFTGLGVPLKTERGNRVFPVSDKAADIIDALLRYVKKMGVKIVFSAVQDITVQSGKVSSVLAGGQHYQVDCIILATGGVSYPLTGSDGDGFRFARTLGHTIIEPKPSLVPVVEAGNTCRELMGLSLRNVQLTVWEDSKKIYYDFGELLFTHFGMSGPLVLSASAHMRHWNTCTYALEIDLKPALDEKQLDRRLLSDFDKYKNSDYINSLGDLLPRKLIPIIVQASDIPAHEKVHAITREQRQALLNVLKHFRIPLARTRPIEEAIITSGGVAVKEIDPKTMVSKKVKGLYFAGEMIDVDGYTGGFNLQIAWSTGFVAGKAAGRIGGEGT